MPTPWWRPTSSAWIPCFSSGCSAHVRPHRHPSHARDGLHIRAKLSLGDSAGSECGLALILGQPSLSRGPIDRLKSALPIRMRSWDMAEDDRGAPRRKLSLVAQVAVLLVVFGLVIWGIGSRTSQAPRANLIPIATPAPSAPFVLTPRGTQQELAFKGAITDCAVQLGGVAACSQTGNSPGGVRNRNNPRG